MGKDSMFVKVFFMHRPGQQPLHSVFVSVFLVSPLHLSNIAHSGLIGFGCHITQTWMKAESCSYACHLKPPGSTRIIKNSHRGNRCDNGTWQIVLPNLWRLVTRVCKAAKRSGGCGITWRIGAARLRLGRTSWRSERDLQRSSVGFIAHYFRLSQWCL